MSDDRICPGGAVCGRLGASRARCGSKKSFCADPEAIADYGPLDHRGRARSFGVPPDPADPRAASPRG